MCRYAASEDSPEWERGKKKRPSEGEGGRGKPALNSFTLYSALYEKRAGAKTGGEKEGKKKKGKRGGRGGGVRGGWRRACGGWLGGGGIP